jgi:hypothetical protein
MELRQDLVVWEEGYDAGMALGTAPPRCPYPAESNEACSWHAGFIEGRAIGCAMRRELVAEEQDLLLCWRHRDHEHHVRFTPS